MATYTPVKPSGLTNGSPELVTAIASGSPQEFHTATSTASTLDEMYLDVANTSAASKALHVMIGATDLLRIDIPARVGFVRILDGYRLDGGLVVNLYAEDNASLVMAGNINRIS